MKWMSHRNRTLVFAPIVVGVFLLAGCGSTTPAASNKPNITIDMVTHACPSDSFWPPVFNGAQAAAKVFGVKLDNIKLTSAQCGNIPAEVSNFETAIQNNPAGIITTIPSSRAFSTDLQTAESKGISVIAMNTAPMESSKNPYLSYVGQPNYQAGFGSGQEAIKLFNLKKGDTVVVDDHEPTNISLTAREKGIAAALKPAGINVVDINTSDNPSTGATVVQAYLQGHSNVSAILTLGTIGTTQVTTALNALNKKIPVGGFDFNTATLNAIQKGIVNYTVDQQPFLQGYMSVEEIVLQKQYGAAPLNINTGPSFLTKNNVNEYGKYASETGF